MDAVAELKFSIGSWDRDALMVHSIEQEQKERIVEQICRKIGAPEIGGLSILGPETEKASLSLQGKFAVARSGNGDGQNFPAAKAAEVKARAQAVTLVGKKQKLHSVAMGRGGENSGGSASHSPSMEDLVKRLSGVRVAAPPQPLPLPHFSKPDVLRRHNAGVARKRMFDNTGLYKTSLNFRGESNPHAASLGDPESLALSNPILLQDLQLERVHRNRVLFATLIGEPFRATSVITVLEDQAGHASIITLSFPSAGESHYPSGTKVAIKDPYFKTAMDGSICIRVDNPDLIVRVNDVSMAVAFRLQGNNLFASKAYADAVDRYTACINGCLDMLTSNTRVATVLEVLLLALSNRAEVYLRVAEFGKAVADADAALVIDVEHVKSLYRKGRGLMGLGEYKEACVWLQKAVDKDPEKAEAKESLNEAREKASCSL
ncbi:hypothetical protein SELMODRAFT_403168 [Selaginella moellendorffii]|uniref:Uncharacterized protein n=1 Tax=Selaginella moellendorffii TaxID=88036 RepID=D8QTB3_SELML|nr:hypothetical protein SELMODRAFT_403168 [Selaginella moellendorffii]